MVTLVKWSVLNWIKQRATLWKVSCSFLKKNGNDNKDFMQDKDMNKNVGADKDKFTISCYCIVFKINIVPC